MSKLKVLYAVSEIDPFLPSSPARHFVKELARYVQTQNVEVRIIAPKFGLINDRKNRLHEVVRLSGSSIFVGEEDKPVLIKVASIPSAKLQVYFIDNEDLFKRKALFHDKEGNFFKDNDDRIVFFCRGVLETVRKLDWSPDVVHCHGWITSLIPLYLKTAYRQEPVFQNARVVYTAYEDPAEQMFNADFKKKITMPGISSSALKNLAEPSVQNLVLTAMRHADEAVCAENVSEDQLQRLNTALPKRKQAVQMVHQGDAGIAHYHALYQRLGGSNA